jgi:hypothetical protein
MTTTQYAEYEAAVNRFLTLNKVKPGCYGPAEHEVEPYFSWAPCECCGSYLGGNRERYHFAYECDRNKGKGFEAGVTVFEAEICSDCVYYLAYGQLDDMTMMDMDKA